jgi:RNA polymerase sigma-70 factor (ECF subfamily)
MESDLNEPASNAPVDKSRLLQQMLHHYADRLEAYVKHKLPSDMRSFVDPRDALQDIFFEAFRRLDEFEPRVEDAAYRWLLTISRHRVLMLIRAHRAVKRGGLMRQRGIDLSEVESMLEELAVYSRTPSQSAIYHEVAAVVQKSLASLKPLFREAIQLRYITGLSAEQSAERMGKTQAAVVMLCRRGLKSLKSHLQEAGAFSNI